MDLPFPSSWKIEWGRSSEGCKGKEIFLRNSTDGTNLCAQLPSPTLWLPDLPFLYICGALSHPSMPVQTQSPRLRAGWEHHLLKPCGDKFYSSCEPITKLHHLQQGVLTRDPSECLGSPTPEVEQFQITFFYARSQIWSLIYCQDTGHVKGSWCLVFCGFIYCIWLHISLV